MKKYLILFLLLLQNIFLFSQDVSFSQFNASRLYLNPANTDTDSTLVLSTGARIQWPKLDNPYQSFYVSADNYYHFLRAGLGFNYLYCFENGGAFTKKRYEFNYAPHITLFHKRAVLKLGFQAALIQYAIDWSKLTFGDQIDERMGFVYNTREVPGRSVISNLDLTQGFLIYSNHYYGGFVASHVTQPDVGLISTSRLPVKFSFYTGANLNFNSDSAHRWVLSPSVLLINQGGTGDDDFINYTIVMPNITVKYRWVSAGVGFRSNNAYVITAGFQNRFLRVGYSYDYTAYGLENQTTGGAHELHLTWYACYCKKANKIKTLRLI
jgi:type IX secretion system PorP/SprF family membrane protein